MLIAGERTPWWLDWVVPIVAGITAIGAAVVWVGRIMILPGIKQELEELLKERFDEVREETQDRHMQNQREISQLRKSLDQAMEDRKKLREQLTEVVADVAYLRGRSSGTFKRPP